MGGMDDERAAEDAHMAAFWADHPATRLGVATRALRAELLKPFERVVVWLNDRLGPRA